MSKAVPLPGITFAGTSYGRNERVFEPLPKGDARRARHREVVRFRNAPHPPERPRWNMSVLDEAHPFPERPIMHSCQRFEGVEVTLEGFPEKIRGTGHLKGKPRAPVWALRESRMNHNHSHSRGKRESFLCRVIRNDSSEAKEEKRRGWFVSTMHWSFEGQIGDAAEGRKSYVEVNKHKKSVLNMYTYRSPASRVEEMNEAIREAKRHERMLKEQTALPQVGSHRAPKVFKMSNIDEWWMLDPTLTAANPLGAPATDVQEVSEDQ